MRSRPEIYQAKAEMCRQGAERAKNSFERDRWLKLVTQWSEMAESAKQQTPDPRLAWMTSAQAIIRSAAQAT